MWIHDNKNNVLYFISNNYTYRPNIAILSLSQTLIKEQLTKENLPFINLYNDNILPFLKQIDENGSIVIIENMQNISIENIKHIVAKFFKLILNEINDLSFMFIFSLKNNKYKKPYTLIYHYLQAIYTSKTDNLIDLENSIMIGNNAGRLKTKLYQKDKYDYDRAFAFNINITFRTPDEMFTSNPAPRVWTWQYNVIEKIIKDQQILVEPSFRDIFTNPDPSNNIKNYLIFVAGPISSGKSLLGNRIKSYLKELDIITIIFDINNYTSQVQMIDEINKISNNTTSIIIIDNCESDKKRNLYFNLFTNNQNYNVKYIEIQASRILCEFLSRFRLQITKTNLNLVNSYEFNNYYNYYSILKSPSINLKYIKYPLILRTRKEIYYHF